ncbi:zinc finger dhhc domain containing protein [Anaeramoeba flamelloides]|uniref:Palmitoyltransferase n=1 Tax=Anaeramoeba flamelloides TaxID=1746091 RepID=A0ABQ8XBT3_9EUKA|nr:zinc finger dhhc domain containing protein [Anaeramoeba flamelloides]
MSKDQKVQTLVGNHKDKHTQSEGDEKTSSTSETSDPNISDNELNKNKLTYEIQPQPSHNSNSSDKEKEGNYKTTKNKPQSNLVYKCLCLKKYKHKQEKYYVCGHVPLRMRLLLPSFLTFCCLIYTTLSTNYFILKMKKDTKQLVFFSIYNFFTLMGTISYLRTLFQNPGFVPISYREENEGIPPGLYDFPIGKEQHNIWREGPRPPRSRYSETFHALILKADHICFLVGTFVAIHNYKFFMLSLFYFTLNSILTIIILFDYLFGVVEVKLIFLSVFTGILALMFFFFLGKILITHIYLISKNLSWLENLQKQNEIKDGEEFINNYNLGCWKNYKQALGKYWIFWFLPLNIGKESDGYSFKTIDL